MAEATLEITTKGKYKNAQLKPKKGVGGIPNGDHVIVEKNFVEGQPITSQFYKNRDGTPQISYSCRVKYNGEEVSFFLNETEHDKYSATGGVGDRVKITLTKEPVLNPVSGLETLVPRLKFELV